VERFLGQAIESRRDQELDVAGEVRGSAVAGYTVRLRLKTVRGSQERELNHEDCRELTEAAALVRALAIDPKLAGGSVNPSDPVKRENCELATYLSPAVHRVAR
jgi:hypothetical protein